jgi:hypothetical protein
MLPQNTRPDVRIKSLSPQPVCNAGSHARSPPQQPSEHTPDDVDAQDNGAVMSAKAAVREYERVQTELTCLAGRSRQLRARLSKIRARLEDFMRARNLERMSTKSGTIVVKVVERSNRVRPGRRATEQCILDTLGPERGELAGKLIQDLYEAQRVKHKTTQVLTSASQ